MSAEIFVLLLGFVVSLLSGLLGIGGGIVMAPALLYLPQAAGLEPLDMIAVSGLTVSQGLFASASGVFRHDRFRMVNRRLVLWMGPSIAVAAFVGALVSPAVGNRGLMLIFGGLAIAAAVLMLVPRTEHSQVTNARDVSFSAAKAIAIAIFVGVLGGMVGQGGSFLLIPLMLHFLGIPTRVAVGSNLGIVLFSAGAGFAGKVITGQVPALLAILLCAGAVPGAQLGSIVSRRTSPRWLRFGLAGVIAVSAGGIALDALL
jgi:uncharacterized membrane protein YfcA